MLRTRRVENLRHGALTTTAGTREGSTITATASPHLSSRQRFFRRQEWSERRISGFIDSVFADVIYLLMSSIKREYLRTDLSVNVGFFWRQGRIIL